MSSLLTTKETAADWWAALRLDERGAAPQETGDPDLATARFEDWKRHQRQADPSQLEELLAARDLDPARFLRLLGEHPSDLRRRLPEEPPWVDTLRSAFERFGDAPNLPPLPSGEPRAGFFRLIAPLVAAARERVLDGVVAVAERGAADRAGGEASEIFDPVTAREILYHPLPKPLLFLITPVLTLELNVARLRGELSGSDPQERFASFCDRLGQPAVALGILREYPVLARQIVLWLDQWADFCLELLERLVEDWDEIGSTFGTPSPGPLVAMEGDLGDRHRGGRAVLRLQFESGFRLVYKPKALAVDRHFQQLLAWLNQRGMEPTLRPLNILDRGEYGWVEYVEHRSCGTRDQVRDFYRRQGAYLALFYALEATDFHYENLIAHGEHPVMVDLEALFHPGQVLVGATPEEQDLLDSVLRVGLLPNRTWHDDESVSIDVSGLGSSGGQPTPYFVAGWTDVGTDQMRYARRRAEMPAGAHRPRVDEETVDVLAYRDEVRSGFTRVYQLLVRHRDELLSTDGPLARFLDDPVRAILRPTRTYGLLLSDGFHPDVLRDAVDRDLLYDRLWVGVEGADAVNAVAEVVRAEQRDLVAGDIPLFTTRPGSRDLWTSDGRRVREFFDETGMDRVRRRLRLLGDTDLERQQWLIQASLTTLLKGEHGAASRGSEATPPEGESEATRRRLLDAAVRAGERLERLAFRGHGKTTWFGLHPVPPDTWKVGPLGLDLYGGLPGVTFFFAALGKVTGEPRLIRLAEESFATHEPFLPTQPEEVANIGAFSGAGGLIYLLSWLSRWWERDDLLARAEDLARCLPEPMTADRQLDVIGGAAGTILGLLALDTLRPAGVAREMAVRCGEHLLEHATAQHEGLAWAPPEHIGSRPLAGFSHGASGIAVALARLAAATGEEHFLSAAQDALAFELGLYHEEAGNWVDLRVESSDSYMVAWCHGAPGVGLARLHLLDHLDDPRWRRDLDRALTTTLHGGFGDNHCLCHGSLGNVELLLDAGRRLDDDDLLAHGRHRLAAVLDEVEHRGFLCGVPQEIDTPGLMNGLAGVGYQCLRLAEPSLPSVLALEPPGGLPRSRP